MRRSVRIILLVLLAACSSSVVPTTVNPPPPPGTPGAASSLTILTGDGQTGSPGSALPVRLSILVKDAGGLAVPGVVVHFAVDSGGGSLNLLTATTGSDGVALGGTWTLGPNPGTNVVSATVGALAPIRYHAQGFSTTSSTLFNNVAIGMGGGTITYTHAGDPLNGLTVVVPAAAYKAPTTWTIVADPTIVVPLPAGFSQVGLALVIGNGQDYADSNMTLTMPMHLAATETAAPFYFDPASKTLEGIPLVQVTDTSMTLATKHFTSNEVAIPGSGLTGGGLRAGLRMGFGTVIVVWVRTNTAGLVGSWHSHFDTGVDDWEFVNYGDYIGPGGDCEGMSVTAIYWQYFFRPGGTGQGLYHQFDQSLLNQWDNVQGIRYAGSVQGDYEKNFSAGVNQVRMLITQGQLHGTSPVTFTARWILLTLKLTGQPVLMALHGPAGGHAVVAYAADFDGTDTEVAFADPNYPGLYREMSFNSGALVPVSLQTNVTATPDLFTTAYAIGVTADVPFNQLLGRWQEFHAGNAGIDRYPKNYHLERQDDLGDWITVPVNGQVWTTLPTLELRHICTDCPIPTAAGNSEQSLEVWGPTGHGYATSTHFAPDPLPAGNSAYIVTLNARSPWARPTDDPGFVDAVPITVRYHDMTIVISAMVLKDSLVTLHASPGPLGTTASVYTWDFGDGSAPVQLTGDSVITHRFTHIGSLSVSVTLSDPTHGHIGTAQVSATVETPRVTFVVQGTWDPDYAPPSGVYTYTSPDALGVRYHDASGIDVIFLNYDLGIDGDGLVLSLVLAPGAQVFLDETFSKTVVGTYPMPGQFGVSIAPDQANPLNYLQAPIGTGTLYIDAVSQMSDGTWVAHYQFNLLNSTGGTVAGSGVAAWR